MNEDILTPADVVNAQLRAYNTRDIEAFAATYTEDVCIYGMPHAKLSLRGKVKLVENYGSKTSTRPAAAAGLNLGESTVPVKR